MVRFLVLIDLKYQLGARVGIIIFAVQMVISNKVY